MITHKQLLVETMMGIPGHTPGTLGTNHVFTRGAGKPSNQRVFAKEHTGIYHLVYDIHVISQGKTACASHSDSESAVDQKPD